MGFPAFLLLAPSPARGRRARSPAKLREHARLQNSSTRVVATATIWLHVLNVLHGGQFLSTVPVLSWAGDALRDAAAQYSSPDASGKRPATREDIVRASRNDGVTSGGAAAA